jgi:hypothetical protein
MYLAGRVLINSFMLTMLARVVLRTRRSYLVLGVVAIVSSALVLRAFLGHLAHVGLSEMEKQFVGWARRCFGLEGWRLRRIPHSLYTRGLITGHLKAAAPLFLCTAVSLLMSALTASQPEVWRVLGSAFSLVVSLIFLAVGLYCAAGTLGLVLPHIL